MNDPRPLVHVESPRHSSDDLESGVQIGDFRIERRLGAGGMGIVYLARQISLDRPVALKVLGQALRRGTDVTRFQREAQAAARLKHPAIAQVYYIGQDKHICYMAMELVDGISLRQALDRLGTTTSADTGLDSAVREDLVEEQNAVSIRFDQPTEELPPGRSVTIMHQVDLKAPEEVNPYLSPKARELRTSAAHVRRCTEVVRDAAEALAHANEQGVIHRDIKPDNLLLDRSGKIHLIDFGVARFFEDQTVTNTGQLVGTPLYMSPEQVTGRGTIDARTDVYSLGLVLYELLTLRPPVEATNRENLLRLIITKPLPPVSWRNSAVPTDLERIVHRATQKDPDQRYPHAAELAADLGRYLSGKPVQAPPYHFRLDEREILAARPGSAMLAALLVFMASFFLFMSIEAMGLMMGIIAINQFGAPLLVINTLLATGILALGVVVGRGLLAARVWARWTGVGLAVLLFLTSTGGQIAVIVGGIGIAGMDPSFLEPSPQQRVKPPSSQAEPGQERGASQTRKPPLDEEMPFSPKNLLFGMLAFYSLPLIVGMLFGGMILWGLLCRPTREWFRFAEEIRREHRLLREQLA